LENAASLRGFLNLNKPAGRTSREIVNLVTKVLRTSRVGHAGTLDPMATGVLVVAVGLATRLIASVQDQVKEYRAEFLLGKRSDTDDVTGTVVDVAAAAVSRQQIEALLPRFRGRIEQVPPAYSAVHVDGERAYAKARRAEAFEIPARTVEVFALELVAFDWPRLELRIECGSGTYIRSIGRDLGELLGCGAVMSALVRTRVGEFPIESAVDPSSLTRATARAALLPLKTAAFHLEQRACTAAETAEIRHGRPLVADGLSPDQEVALIAEGELIALARFDAARQQLRPYLVLKP
jgi:tRNA pseudouridine55 synthase